MRCFTEEDLEKAKSYFEKAGQPALWVERPRASHSVLQVKDLAKSRAFYVDLIGLIVSAA